MELRERLQDYTRAEFVALVELIAKVDSSESEHNKRVEHFDRLVMHPKGADLLFYPDVDDDYFGDDGLAKTIHEVKKWHNANGHLAFKDDLLPLPVQRPSRTGPQPSASDRALMASAENLIKVQKIAEQINEASRTAQQAFQQLETLLRVSEARPAAPVIEVADSVQVMILEAELEALETAVSAVTDGVYRHASLEFTVKFAKDDAQRSLSHRHLHRETQVSILQQMTQSSDQYFAQRPPMEQRQLELHVRAQAAFKRSEEHLVRVAAASGAGPLNEPVMFAAAAHDIDGLPQVLTPYSDMPGVFDGVLPALKVAIRSAVGGLAWDLTAARAEPLPAHASVMAFQFDRPGCGQPFAVSLPLSELGPVEGRNWSYLAASGAEVELPFRLSSAVASVRHGTLSQGLQAITELANIYVVSTSGLSLPAKVKVAAAEWDAGSGVYRFSRPGHPEHTVVWASQPLSEAPTTTLKRRQRGSRPGYIAPAGVPMVEAIPVIEDVHFSDCIVVFPPDSGIAPVYLMFKGNREYPGVATGNGQRVNDGWLRNGAEVDGAAIPSQIADQLRGRVFKRFSLFREAFWLAVANTPELAKGFSASELDGMRQGRGPGTTQNSQWGRMYIHSVVPPERAAGVYDMDTMLIMQHG